MCTPHSRLVASSMADTRAKLAPTPSVVDGRVHLQHLSEGFLPRTAGTVLGWPMPLHHHRRRLEPSPHRWVTDGLREAAVCLLVEVRRVEPVGGVLADEEVEYPVAHPVCVPAVSSPPTKAVCERPRTARLEALHLAPKRHSMKAQPLTGLRKRRPALQVLRNHCSFDGLFHLEQCPHGRPPCTRFGCISIERAGCVLIEQQQNSDKIRLAPQPSRFSPDNACL
jgi:hypothetical protein